MSERERCRVTCIVGTRPEAIKMAPVIKALRGSGWAQCTVIATAQHRSLLDRSLADFGIVPDVDLDLMTEGQTLGDLTGRLMPTLATAIGGTGAQIVLAQGDTATVFAAALTAFYQRIPFGHVEAGLRTYDLQQPFPEEAFRQMVARLARWHFAPTETAAGNLRNERIRPESIFVTGNTGIDALLSVAAEIGGSQRQAPSPLRRVLMTAHRRENFGRPLEQILLAIGDLVQRHPDIEVVYPVHPNPNVRSAVDTLLKGLPRVTLCEPLDYRDFVAQMVDATLILTDSGGIQEEAPALARPVLVLREQTERPEAVAAGVVEVVGTERRRIVEAASRLLSDPQAYAAMARGVSPYGDGHAAARIAGILERDFLGGKLPA